LPQIGQITIKQEKFDSLIVELGWNGEGTKNNPIIVNNLSSLPPIIRFVNLTTHIIFKNLTIERIMFVKCRNITVQGCQIQLLRLLSSQDIVVKNNTINAFGITLGGNNLIAQNRIHRNNFSNAKKRSFEKMVNRGLLLVVVIIIILVAPLLIFVTIMLNTPWMLYFVFSIVLMPLSFYFYWIFIRNRSRNLPPNQFEGNIAIDDEN